MTATALTTICLVAFLTGCGAQSTNFNFVCTFVDSLSCQGTDQTPVCASNGQTYASECLYTKAHCKDVSLKPVDCSAVNSTTIMVTNTTDSPAVTNVTTDSPADANLTMNPPADANLTMNPPADANLTMNPPADTNVTMNPPADANLTMNPPADTNLTMNPPADARLTSSNTTDVQKNSTSIPMTTEAATTVSNLGIVCQTLLANPCPPDNSSVCASDLVSYDSLCEYTKARCLDPGLTVIQQGSCGSITTPAPDVAVIVCRALADSTCYDDGIILCGSDGITYSNSCLFEKAKCQKTSLTVQYVGNCSK
ncbi:hypothetical protein RRG08_051185 [Elysia crispata]|uniref:Kazal-like domain-containing protein n=1 Tax=Elysia crispata TaxID=231223 RepID=A0AAE1DBT0_9GAST|nr:hypothetical protein RRG08_051185 [Elysia crispata]